MPDEIVEQPIPSLRDTITENVEAAEAGVLETPREDRARDESGKFVKVERTEAPKVEAKPVAPTQTQEAVQPQAPVRPTTWRKEYLPIWDKLASGQPITPEEAKKLAEYSTQRENEYKTGVSTYKSEAMQAKELQEAITPFLPELQAHGMKPAQWIKELGAANYVLIKGTPQQKLQMFHNLAQRYGVPLAALQQQPNQGVVQLMGIIADLKNQVGQLSGWKTDLENRVVAGESQKLQGEVEKFAADSDKHPHFEAVREQMAQLLEAGLAPDLDSAYEQACYLNPEVRTQVLSASQQPSKGQVAAQARARAVSPRSSTPSGQVAKPSQAKDLRSAISEAFEAHDVGGRV